MGKMKNKGSQGRIGRGLKTIRKRIIPRFYKIWHQIDAVTPLFLKRKKRIVTGLPEIAAGSRNKILICRPQHGLNDMLCRIELCARYARKHNRILFIDTNYHGSINLRVKFSDFFVSRDASIRLDLSTLDDFGPYESIYPLAKLADLNEYKLVAAGGSLVSNLSRKPISFDFKKDFKEDILVFSGGGGGVQSIEALGRMHLHPRLIGELQERIGRMGGGAYEAIHVRNTDHKTDYAAYLARLPTQIHGPLFLATDNSGVLEDFRRVFGDRLFSFANLTMNDGRPIHLTAPESFAFEAMEDAVLDLMMLVRASKMHVLKSSTTKNDTLSGYTRLALELRRRPDLQSSLLALTED